MKQVIILLMVSIFIQTIYGEPIEENKLRLRRNSVLLDIVHDLLDVLHEETETRLLRAKAAVKNKEMKIAHLFPKLFKEIKKPLLTNDID